MKNLNPNTGVVEHELASLKPIYNSPLKGCEEFAVIGFWDFRHEYNRHKCERFFYVPYPMTRTVKDSDMNKVKQLLYVGKNDEVFFFFEDNYETKNQFMSDDHNAKVCLGIIDCEKKNEDLLKDCDNL